MKSNVSGATKYLGIVGAAALTTACLVMGFIVVVGADTKAAFGLGVGALAGAVVSALVGIGSGCGNIDTAGSLQDAGLAVALGTTLGIADSAGAVACIGSGVLLFALVCINYVVVRSVKDSDETADGSTQEIA